MFSCKPGDDLVGKFAKIIESELETEEDFSGSALVLNIKEEPDLILAAYHDPAQKNGVLAFFRDLTGSYEIAEAVLANAARNDIRPSLAFALCWAESRYNPQAINRNRNNSVDRGLFQLNSESFPNLKVEEFYNPGISARYGLSHLRWCLDSMGTEVAALAMYNAGYSRVRSDGTPQNTLNYISQILKRQLQIEALFNEYFIAKYIPNIEAEIVEAAEESRKPFRLSLLTPLGR